MENTAARKRKQVPEGYLIIGVDPHKKRHAAVAITQDFTTRDKFKFDNTREGLETLLRRAKTEMVKTTMAHFLFTPSPYLNDTTSRRIYPPFKRNR